MIGVGVQYKGGQNISITTETNLYTAFSGVTQIMFAYCAHVAFFGLIAEMEEPKDFPKALCLLQGFEISLYVTAAIVIYYYVGNGVDSPALGSAGPVLKKVAYGMAIPTVSLPPFGVRGFVLMCVDYWCWCGQRTCWSQVHLCAHLPQVGTYAQERLGLRGILDRYWRDLLGDCLDHRRGYPIFQQPGQSDQFAVCQLVQFRSAGCLLAAHELRAVVVEPEEVRPDHHQHAHLCHWWCYGKFSPIHHNVSFC